MPDQSNLVSLPWRRFLRFRVRAMIVLVLVMGVWLGWFVRSARSQRDAVAAITKADGLVFYDWNLKNGRKIEESKPWSPSWLVNAIGVDYFGSVAAVILPKASDDELIHIGRFNHLRLLVIGKLEATNSGLAHLRGLTNLSRLDLDLNYTRVTDAGLVHLKCLSPISAVELVDTQVTDTGLCI